MKTRDISIFHPFRTSSNTLLIYVELPRLLIQRRKTLSSLESWVSSSNESRRELCFARAESPFLLQRNWISLHILHISTKACAGEKDYYYHLIWKICATKARLRFGEPSTISLAVKYLLQPIFSACSRTSFALSNGFFTANVDGLVYSDARTFRRCA